MAKLKAKFRRPAPAEQHVLEHLHTRLVSTPADLRRFDALLIEHHYLHSAALVGEHLRYVATHRGRWLALASFSAAAYHLRSRDQFIGWSPAQRRRRLPLLVNHSRFLILPECHYPNLPSRLLKLLLARLAEDWSRRVRDFLAGNN